MYLLETRSIVSRSAARSLVGREMDRFTTPTVLHFAASSRRSRLLRDECRFTLRGVLVFLVIVGVSFCMCFQLNPLWVALLFAYTSMAYGCSRSAIRKAVWLPLAIVALHTILYRRRHRLRRRLGRHCQGLLAIYASSVCDSSRTVEFVSTDSDREATTNRMSPD